MLRPTNQFIFFAAAFLLASCANAQDSQEKLLRKAWEDFFSRQESALESSQDQIPTPAESQQLALESTNQFSSPKEIVSQNGVLQANLVVDYSIHQIGSDPVRLRTYNGQLVGPTLRVKPGDKILLKLVNNLPNEVSHSGDLNSHHEWNTTNLHTHGLHVSPSGKSDNVYLSIAPGTSFSHEIDIPRDHPAGTFWYHAHKHGAVSAQVASGMSGALIVEGDPNASEAWAKGVETVPQIGKAKEQVLVFQQIPYILDLGFGVVERTHLAQLFGPRAWDQLGRHTTVNGIRLPTFVMRPGEVQRWRMIHSGFRESLHLRLLKAADGGDGPESIRLNEIAVDGLALHKINQAETIEMWPGYRSDILIKAPVIGNGTYLLVDERTGPVNSLNGLSENRKFVAKLVVEGEPLDMAIPDPNSIMQFRLPSIAPGSVSGVQNVTYGINLPLAFEVDGKEYDPSVVRRLQLGKTEEWIARSVNDVGIVHHPFHIHVNPFEVFSIIDANGNETLTHPIWRDTIILRAGWTVRFRTSYKRFSGKFVQHCHILDHEDQGMMEAVEIFDPNSPSPLESMEFEVADLNKIMNGKTTVLNFFVGSSCSHCNKQLANLDKKIGRFKQLGISVVCVSSNQESGLNYQFPIVSDPNHEIFRKYNCFKDGPLHGTLLFDETGKEVWKVSGDAPFNDFDTLLETIGSRRNSTVGSTDQTSTHVSALEAAGEASSITAENRRKNIDDLTEEELETLKHAFRKTKENNPTLYAQQISLHNGSSGPCEHGSERFLPWHRAHLYFFEKHLRESDPPRTSNIRLPYWNWTETPSGNRYPKAYEDSSSILFHAVRRRTGPALPTKDEIDEILEIDDWADFGGGLPSGFGELEFKPHNFMHGGYIGGSMGNPSDAANDPIYWAFHCYLDLLWDKWQKKHGKSPSSLDTILRGMPGSMTVSDVLDVENQLDYTYMTSEETILAVREIESPLESANDFRKFEMNVTIPELKSNQIPKLYFSAVKTPTNRSYRADLYLHPKGIPFEDNDNFRKNYNFDYFVMWKSPDAKDGQGSHHPIKAPIRLRGISKILKRVTAEQKGKDWQITMVCRPIGEESALESAEPIDIEFGSAKLILKD